MSPAEAARAVRLRLAGEMVDDRAALDRLAEAIAKLVPPASDERGEWMRGLALAFEVERYYTAVETLLTRVLRTIDGDVPTGAGWHQEILRGASVSLEGLRPAVVPPEIVADMRELLKFRHLARHGYEAEPVLPRMIEHAERVARAHPTLVSALDAFGAWLRAG